MLTSRLLAPFYKKPFHPPLKRQRYPWEKPRGRMSIAIGVVCTNGVVLGTDLEYTGSYEKFPGPKLWHLCPERQRSILLTGAGNPTSIDHVKRIAEQEIRKTGSDHWEDVVFAVEAGLRSLYSLHIDPVPSKEEKEALDVWIMLAVPDGFRFRSIMTAPFWERSKNSVAPVLACMSAIRCYIFCYRITVLWTWLRK